MKFAKFVKGAKGAEVEDQFEDGGLTTQSFLAHKPKSKLDVDLVEQLGLMTTGQGGTDVNFPVPYNK